MRTQIKFGQQLSKFNNDGKLISAGHFLNDKNLIEVKQVIRAIEISAAPALEDEDLKCFVSTFSDINITSFETFENPIFIRYLNLSVSILVYHHYDTSSNDIDTHRNVKFGGGGGDDITDSFPSMELKISCVNFIKRFLEFFATVANYSSRSKAFRCQTEICLDTILRIVLYLRRYLYMAQTENLISWAQYLKLIRIMARSDAVGSKMTQDPIHIIHLLAEILHKSSNDQSMVSETAAILANMAPLKEARQQIISLGCLNQILNILSNEVSNSSMYADIKKPLEVTEICACLANLALFDESCKIIIERKGMEALMHILSHSNASPDLQTQTLNAITNISKMAKSSSFGSARYNDSKVSELLETIINISAVNTIGSLAFAKYNFGVVWKEKLTRMILESMNRFAYASQFQISCCFAIAHLCYGNVLDMLVFKELNGLSLILTCMSRFKYNRSLQTTACFTLGSLAMMFNEIREDIMEKGGVNLMFDTLDRKFPPKSLLVSSQQSSQKIITAFHVDKIHVPDINEDDPSDNIERTTFIANEEENESIEEDAQNESSLSSRNSRNSGFINIISIDEPNEIKAKKLQKNLLLHMFISVALMNISENEKCKEELMNMGVLHYLFKAYENVKHVPELNFVLANVFMKFTHVIFSYTYLKPRCVLPLSELCQISLSSSICSKQKSLQAKFEEFKEPEEDAMLLDDIEAEDSSSSSSSWIHRFPWLSSLSTLIQNHQHNGRRRNRKKHQISPFLVEALRDEMITKQLEIASVEEQQKDIPLRIRTKLEMFKECETCKGPTFEVSSIRFYYISIGTSLSLRFCSEDCAQSFQFSACINGSILQGGDRIIRMVNLDPSTLTDSG